MHFHFGFEETILLECWKTTGYSDFLFAAAIIGFLAFLIEAADHVIRNLVRQGVSRNREFGDPICTVRSTTEFSMSESQDGQTTSKTEQNPTDCEEVQTTGWRSYFELEPLMLQNTASPSNSVGRLASSLEAKLNSSEIEAPEQQPRNLEWLLSSNQSTNADFQIESFSKTDSESDLEDQLQTSMSNVNKKPALLYSTDELEAAVKKASSPLTSLNSSSDSSLYEPDSLDDLVNYSVKTDDQNKQSKMKADLDLQERATQSQPLDDSDQRNVEFPRTLEAVRYLRNSLGNLAEVLNFIRMDVEACPWPEEPVIVECHAVQEDFPANEELLGSPDLQEEDFGFQHPNEPSSDTSDTTVSEFHSSCPECQEDALSLLTTTTGSQESSDRLVWHRNNLKSVDDSAAKPKFHQADTRKSSQGASEPQRANVNGLVDSWELTNVSNDTSNLITIVHQYGNNDPLPTSAGPSRSPPAPQDRPERHSQAKPSANTHFRKTLIYGARTCLYILTFLSIISLNVWLCLAHVIGRTLGYFLFQRL